MDFCIESLYCVNNEQKYKLFSSNLEGQTTHMHTLSVSVYLFFIAFFVRFISTIEFNAFNWAMTNILGVMANYSVYVWLLNPLLMIVKQTKN